ncbi:MAG: hypothetical protein LUH59_04830 [Firmicutes bacterium]|nr:hypothetical protein [Bacillota bacterium]MCD7832012.1 hypothetical protein [Bacillota bacterium]
MKKSSLYLILVCFAAILTVSSCSESGTIVALEIGGIYDADDGGNHAPDYNVWYSEDRLSFEDSTVDSTYTIEVDGTEYSGKYSYSAIEVYNNYQSDYYTIQSDIYNGEFAINHDTDDVVLFLLFNAGDESISTSISIDVNRKKADDYVSQFVSLDDYDVEFYEGEYTHRFIYTKVIDGIETYDCISVCISPKTGKINVLSVGMLGSVNEKDAVASVSALTSKSAEQVLEEKIYAIYSECDSYEIKNETLVILDSGEYGIVYRIDALYANNDESNACTTNILVCYSSSVTE